MERSANARRRYRPTLILIALLAVLIALLCTVCVPMRVSAGVSPSSSPHRMTVE
jgi:hypothetical protein